MKYYCPFCLAEIDESDLTSIEFSKRTYNINNLPLSMLVRDKPTFYTKIFFANMLKCNKKSCREVASWAAETPFNLSLLAMRTKEYKSRWFGRWIYDEKNYHRLERLNSFILGSYLSSLASKENKRIGEENTENKTRIKLKNGRWKSNCKHCEKMYFHDYETQCYCSKECRDTASKMRKKSRTLLGKTLQKCL